MLLVPAADASQIGPEPPAPGEPGGLTAPGLGLEPRTLGLTGPCSAD